MEMSEENYRIERQRCLKQMIQYELKKDPAFLHPFLKLKSYLQNKPQHEKDKELIEKYLITI